jgi:hypothetical protein
MGSVYNTISLFCQPTLITIADHQDAMDPNKKEKRKKKKRASKQIVLLGLSATIKDHLKSSSQAFSWLGN